MGDVHVDPPGRDSPQGGFYNPEMYDDPMLAEMFEDIHITRPGRASGRGTGRGSGRVPGRPSARRSGKGRGKKNQEEEEEEPIMGDLIAHRYMREAAEREAARKLAEQQAKRCE